MRRALRSAAPILVVYWLVLVSGLGCYTVLRGPGEVASIQPLWYGAIIGTLFGQVFALKNLRPWLLVVIVSFVVCWAIGFDGGTLIWMAFVPAVLCGYWSLGDRTSLVAFWYPAMIWMLSILDQTTANGVLESAGVGLVVALAVMFVVFLRARETRRVALWRTIAFDPLAKQTAMRVLKEPPGRQLSRATWIVTVGTLACGLTAWIAPSLWHAESYEHHEQRTATSSHIGLACCPIVDDVSMRRVRVKEYMNLGRGRDEVTAHRREACHVCGASGATYVPAQTVYTRPSLGGETGGYYSGGYGYSSTAVETGGVYPQTIRRDYNPTTTTQPIAATVGEGAVQPTTALPPPVQMPPMITANAPPSPPLDVPAPQPAPPASPSTAPSANSPRQQPSGAIAEPGAAVSVAQPATMDDRASHPIAARVLYVIAALLGIALLAQLALLALRPVRRRIALRHLREPLWTETVDQRISNSWQLALVGLRDAGWRTTDDETPRELARRAGIEGVEECAAILERARHGIGIDAGDLDAMRAHADIAYRSARSRLGWVGKAIAATRWPLA